MIELILVVVLCASLCLLVFMNFRYLESIESKVDSLRAHAGLTDGEAER